MISISPLFFFKYNYRGQRQLYRLNFLFCNISQSGDKMWNQGGFGGGYGGGYGGGGFVNTGFGNRWGNSGINYQSMNGFAFVDYSGGWNPNMHDQMLRNNIQLVFNQYDMNRTGQLEGNEFFFAYRDLCLRMGLCPPATYQDFFNAAMACDLNRDGRYSRQEMYYLFLRIQGINSPMLNQGVVNMGGFGGVGINMGGMGMGMGGMGMGGMGGW